MKRIAPMVSLLALLILFTGLVGARVLPSPIPQVSIARSLTLQPKVVMPSIVPLARITAYNPIPSQTDSNPGESSCGPTKQHQIALSQDLFFRPDGTKRCGEKVALYDATGHLIVKGVVWDTMNKRYTHAADILFPTPDTSKTLNFGVHTGYLVFLN